MKQLNPIIELREFGMSRDLELEVQLLENNNRVADLLIKKGYKIKKPVWNGLIAS